MKDEQDRHKQERLKDELSTGRTSRTCCRTGRIGFRTSKVR